ncbi:MAG: hypothetical protein GF400_01615 [Candidatus Eisenbacteria bacterium]|nr:hypothetical protein [Candidatus Eisenbacteria bacterium]
MAKTLLCAVLLACLPTALTAAGGDSGEQTPVPSLESIERAVLRLEAVRDLDDLSRALWPDWEVSEAAFALHGGDGGLCVLVHHPSPPEGFDSERTSGRSRHKFHITNASALDPASARLNDEPTTFLEWTEFENNPLAAAFEQSFSAHLRSECPDLRRLDPPIDGYPVTPENLALSDVECELLAAAVLAPDDSLEQRTLEFVAVRNYRRLRMDSPAAEAFEKRLEHLEGGSAYIGLLAGERAAPHLDGDRELLDPAKESVFDPVASIRGPRGLDWYRRDRYRATGAALCRLMDRFQPDWKEEAGLCGDPFELLYESTMTRLPRAFKVLMRFRLSERVEERCRYIESLKSDAERLYDDIVECEGLSVVINTRLLQSTSVSYDPQNLEHVDEHRAVHKRVLKIEFSGGTRVHVLGIPSAVNTGEDEFDIQQLTVAAPERFRVEVGGAPLALDPGVHEFDRPISVTGDGLLIEARAGVIMVGEEKLTLVLHR